MRKNEEYVFNSGLHSALSDLSVLLKGEDYHTGQYNKDESKARWKMDLMENEKSNNGSNTAYSSWIRV